MNRLPWFQFFPADWIKETRDFSIIEKGAWIDLLSFMWESKTRGQIVTDWDRLSRMIGVRREEVEGLISGMAGRSVFDLVVTNGNSEVTLISRRMTRAEEIRESARLRKRAFDGRARNGLVTDKKSEVRSQKSEKTKNSVTPKSAVTTPFLNEVVRHVVEAWEKKKRAKYPYQGGKHSAMLKKLIGFYQAGGVMALWDLYLETADDWTKSKGLTIEIFYGQVTRLVDNAGWKEKARAYNDKLFGSTAGDVLSDALSAMQKNMKLPSRK